LRRREEVGSRESIVGSRKAGEYRTIEQGTSNDEVERTKIDGIKRIIEENGN
jgi:hypothetical protein